jgi:hypothetical protein
MGSTRLHAKGHHVEAIWRKRYFRPEPGASRPLWFPLLLDEDSRKFNSAVKKPWELLDLLARILIQTIVYMLVNPNLDSSRSVEKLVKKMVIPRMEKAMEKFHSNLVRDLEKYCYSLPNTGIIIHLVSTSN